MSVYRWIFVYVMILCFTPGAYCAISKINDSAAILLAAQDRAYESKASRDRSYFFDLKEEAKEFAKSSNYREAIKAGFRALKLYQTYRWKDVLVRDVYNVLSHSLENIGAYTDAIYYHKRLIQNFDFNNEYIKRNYFLLERVGILYKELKEYDSAIFYFQKGRDYALKKTNDELIGHSYNNLGLMYLNKGQRGQAQENFLKALRFYEQVKNQDHRTRFMISLIKGNIADFLVDTDPRKMQYLKEDVEGSVRYGDYSSATSSSSKLALYLIRIGKSQEAKGVLERAETFGKKEKVSLQSQIELCDAWMQFYVGTKQEDQILTCHNRQLNLIQERYNSAVVNQQLEVYSNYELYQIQSELEVEKLQLNQKKAEIIALNQQKEIIRFRWAMVLVIGLFVLSMATVLIFKQRGDIRKRAKEKALMEKIHRIEEEIKTERLQKSALSVSRKKDFSDRLMQQINSFENLGVEERNTIRMTLLNEREIDESVLEEEKQIQEVGEEFIAQLKLKFPNLNEGDIKLLSLVKMNLSNKQIAEIRLINIASVKKAKNRLRKKMDIPSGEDFSDFI